MALDKVYNLAALGLSAIEVRVIKSVCAITAGRQYSFRVNDVIDESNAPDIVLINEESPESMSFWGKFNQERNIPAVVLSRTIEDRHGYLLKRPMVPGSLLKILEEISVKESDRIQKNRQPKDISLHAEFDASSTSGLHAPFRVLVVDDSTTIRKQMELAIKQIGGEVVCVDTGEAALDILLKQEFDMLFLDVVLPGADGYAICRTIKKNRKTKQLPIIMLTGKSSPFDKIRGNLAGCDTYLTKPVDLKVFQSTIKKYMPNEELFSYVFS
ncbi:response regulator [Undibacterium sp. MH2W]|uniref:response regulator n=1 Tax=Undibacterium sp. MH2W TaxID=3413044 RepID=UPI003BF14910